MIRKVDQTVDALKGLGKYGTILIDPPWRFQNRTGKVAPEHRRLHRYRTMSHDELLALPVGDLGADKSHLYLWCPNALLDEGLALMARWGFKYKGNLVWLKVRKDGGPDGRGVGFYFRNVTELILFGVKGGLRTRAPGRRQVNLFATRKREHSRKPDELYGIVEACSPGPFVELFAREGRPGWTQWGDEVGKVVPWVNGYSRAGTVGTGSRGGSGAKVRAGSPRPAAPASPRAS